MLFKKSFLLVFACLAVATAAMSQGTPTKYGHMNLGNLLEAMPETKKANEDLKVMTEKLSAKDDSLTKAFQTAYSKLEKDYSDGVLNAIQLKDRQAELQKQQEFIQQFEQDAQKQVSAKREELLSPILKRIEEAVKKVAVDNGFALIFDSSTGVMLFASETVDVTALVKKQLGLP